MNVIQKREAIKNGLRKGFQGGSSKMARRKCYGYMVSPDGDLVINPDEAKIVCQIFEWYLAGDSLGKIVAALEKQGILFPAGRPKWNREAIDKLLSNEKYTGQVLLQKTISTDDGQIENDVLMSISIFILMLMRTLFLMKYSWQLNRRSSAELRCLKTRLS